MAVTRSTFVEQFLSTAGQLIGTVAFVHADPIRSGQRFVINVFVVTEKTLSSKQSQKQFKQFDKPNESQTHPHGEQTTNLAHGGSQSAHGFVVDLLHREILLVDL